MFFEESGIITIIRRIHEDMRRYLALQYFKDKRLSMGKAAKLAGINRFEFMDFLASEGIVIYDYDTTAVDEELEGVKRLKELSL
ncbi:MAG: UPF0175 family protein [Nitrospirae bacterium]|nr:UPF0175 family protein [Nitrospirota bacterium]